MRRNNGTGLVFRFTLGQYLKSRSVLVSMVVMLVVSLASMLVAAGSMSVGLPQTTDIRTIRVFNETGTAFGAEDVLAQDSLFTDTAVVFGGESGENEVAVRLIAENGGCVASAQAEGWEQTAPAADVARAAQAVASAYDSAREAALGIVTPGVSVIGEREYRGEAESESSGITARSVLTYVYDIAVMILVLFASSYIVRSVIEEKAGKLVETLTVSVKPMELLAGKILACMCLVLIELAVLAAGFVCASKLSTSLFGGNALTHLAESVGLGSVLSGLDLGTAALLLVALLLAYGTFSVVGGLAGVGCSNMEDVEGANLSVVLTVMLGYIVSVAAASFEGPQVAAVTSLLPVIGIFTAPVRYIMGDISLWILLAAYGVQAAVLAVLMLLCRRVYGVMLFYKGSRVKIGKMLRMGKEGAR